MTSYFRCRLGIVRRSRGGSAIRRAAYQACTRIEAPDGRVFDYSRNRIEHGHLRTVMLLPRNSPAWAREPKCFWTQAVLAERRIDAQEARTFDIALPRKLPPELWDDCVRAMMAPFIADGMALQADIHLVEASDGEPNPHVHIEGAMRRVNVAGFSSHKARDWNAQFFRKSQVVRTQIAENLNTFCAQHGIDYHADPRSNKERGLPEAEPTVPRWNILYAKRTGTCTAWLTERNAIRAARQRILALEDELEEINSAIVVEQDAQFQEPEIFALPSFAG